MSGCCGGRRASSRMAGRMSLRTDFSRRGVCLERFVAAVFLPVRCEYVREDDTRWNGECTSSLCVENHFAEVN